MHRSFSNRVEVGPPRPNDDSAVGTQVVALSLVALQGFCLTQRLSCGFLFLLFRLAGKEDWVVSKQVLSHLFDVFQVGLGQSANRIELVEVKDSDAKGMADIFENLDRVRRCVLLFKTVCIFDQVVRVDP